MIQLSSYQTPNFFVSTFQYFFGSVIIMAFDQFNKKAQRTCWNGHCCERIPHTSMIFKPRILERVKCQQQEPSQIKICLKNE